MKGRRWSHRLPLARDLPLLAVMLGLSILGLLLPSGHTMLSQQQRVYLRDEAREMFYHSFNSYMDNAYPLDELMPLSCQGRDWEKRDRGTLDDPLGGYALTLIDSLDMLATLGDFDRFYEAVQIVIRDVKFERNVTISLFEATIRVLGGLLSAHSLLEAEELEPVFRHREPKYDGQLLDLAYDLGVRLLPAFDTRTGIPVHRVNLMFGVSPQETRETCTAAAGTLILEMGLLSRLTGDYRFERAARRSLKALWDRRSTINLVGSTIHTQTGRWMQTHSGIGAGIDSFYEYLLKAYIMFGDEELLDWFTTAYQAVQDHTLWGPWNVEVSMARGKWQPHSFRVSALQAFWPSLQVLAGELQAAKVSHRAFYSLWREFDALPEIFDARGRQLIQYARDSPLRPEFVESTYHLYMATRDPHYLNVGKEVLFSLQNRTRVECGFASIADVTSRRLDDRMDSFFLAETLKYLYLLFDNSLEPELQTSLFCPLGGHSSTSSSSSSSSSNSSAGAGGDDSVQQKRPCIPLVRTLFTTEGHIFFVEQDRHAKSAKQYLTRTGKMPPNKGRVARSTASRSSKSPPVTGPPTSRRDQGTCAVAQPEASIDPAMDELDDGGERGGLFSVLEPFAASDSFRMFETEVMKVFNTIRIDPTGGSVPGLVLQCDEDQQRCRIGRLARSPVNLILSGFDRALASSQDGGVDSGGAVLMMTAKAVGYPGNFGPDLRSMGFLMGQLKAPLGSEAESKQYMACEELGKEEASRLVNSIALVLRGQCSFVTKARNVQKAGAVGLVVLDAKGIRGGGGGGLGPWGEGKEEESGEWEDEEDWPEDGQQEEEEEQQQQQQQNGVATAATDLFMSWQVMADDGSGADINIPATMVTGRNARVVQNILRASPHGGVVLRMTPDDALAIEEEDMVELATKDAGAGAAAAAAAAAGRRGLAPGPSTNLVTQKHPLLEGVFLKFAESVQTMLGGLGVKPLFDGDDDEEEEEQKQEEEKVQDYMGEEGFKLHASHEAFASAGNGGGGHNNRPVAGLNKPRPQPPAGKTPQKAPGGASRRTSHGHDEEDDE